MPKIYNGKEYITYEALTNVYDQFPDPDMLSGRQKKLAERYLKTGRELADGNIKPVAVSADSDIIELGKRHIKMDLQLFAENALSKQNPQQLRKGIKTLEERIAEHTDKIANPEKYYPDWDEFDERYKNGCIRHWEKEIQNSETSIQSRIEELRARGEEL